jgi:hypothetical protein
MRIQMRPSAGNTSRKEKYMKTVLAFVVTLVLAVPALSQGREEPHTGTMQRPAEPPRGEMQHPAPAPNAPRANQGRIPPSPPKREPSAKPEAQRVAGRYVNNTPHVADDHWYGRPKPNDRRYVLAHPFEHGHFERFGPSYRYNIVRVDPNLHRFWLPNGYYFDIAAWEWPLVADWCWTCADDFVIYEDPDHPGWYLLYNLMTGAFVHVMYMGA